MSATPAERPLVTFFVMAYRQEALVREAIESAFAQTYEPLEIILSDDNSPDGTYAVMEAMAAAYDGPHAVRLNRNPVNLGVCGHLDRIMDLASGDFVVQNAGDDVSLPQRTERLAEIWLASGREAKLVHSTGVVIDADGTEIGLKNGARPGPAPSALEMIRRNLYILGAACAWDRELFDRFGPLGAGLGVEDTVLPVRAAALGRIVHVDEPLMKWRAGGLSWASRETRRARDYLRDRLKVMRWHAATHARLAEDLARIDFPGRDACLAANAARRERVEFELALADAGWLGGAAQGPRAAALSARARDGFFLRQWVKHVMGPLYARYLDLRYRPDQMH